MHEALILFFNRAGKPTEQLMLMLSTCRWRGNTGTLTKKEVTSFFYQAVFDHLGTKIAYFWCFTCFHFITCPQWLNHGCRWDYRVKNVGTFPAPSQQALSASSTTIAANRFCRCFCVQLPALPLVPDDVICKCCEGNSDVMCFYIYIFIFLGSTWTGKEDSTDHWTSLLDEADYDVQQDWLRPSSYLTAVLYICCLLLNMLM